MSEHAGAERVELDTHVYRMEAIKKAAYRFGGRCFVRVEQPTPDKAIVTLEPKEGTPSLNLSGEFLNEVLDQELREVVAQETAAVRNLILAQAYSNTGLLDSEGETANFREDPLGIRNPEAP